MPARRPKVKLSASAVVKALRVLDADQRAILDLSLRQRLDDDEVATVMGIDRPVVAALRTEAIARLSGSRAAFGRAVGRQEMREALLRLSVDDWRRGAGDVAPTAARPRPGPDEASPAPAAPRRATAPRTAPAAPESQAAPPVSEAAPPASEAAPVRAPAPGPPAPPPSLAAAYARLRRIAVIVAVVAAAVAAALVGLLLARSQDGGRGGEAAPPPRPGAGGPAGVAAPAGPPVALRPVRPGIGGHGTARLIAAGPDPRVELAVRGLPSDASYVVWLFNAAADARPVGRFERGHAVLTLRPRARLRAYRLLDISLERPGVVRAHSGRSLLRAPTARLLPPPAPRPVRASLR